MCVCVCVWVFVPRGWGDFFELCEGLRSVTGGFTGHFFHIFQAPQMEVLNDRSCMYPKDLGPSNLRVWTCIARVGSSKWCHWIEGSGYLGFNKYSKIMATYYVNQSLYSALSEFHSSWTDRCPQRLLLARTVQVLHGCRRRMILGFGWCHNNSGFDVPF